MKMCTAEKNKVDLNVQKLKRIPVLPDEQYFLLKPHQDCLSSYHTYKIS